MHDLQILVRSTYRILQIQVTSYNEGVDATQPANEEPMDDVGMMRMMRPLGLGGDGLGRSAQNPLSSKFVQVRTCLLFPAAVAWLNSRLELGTFLSLNSTFSTHPPTFSFCLFVASPISQLSPAHTLTRRYITTPIYRYVQPSNAHQGNMQVLLSPTGTLQLVQRLSDHRHQKCGPPSWRELVARPPRCYLYL